MFNINHFHFQISLAQTAFKLKKTLGCITLIQDEVPIRKSKLLETLPIVNPKFEVKFDIFPTSLPSVTWASIVHLTVGNNIGEHGDRIPGIWLNSNSFWYVTSSVSGNKDHWHKFTNVSLNSWTSFRIWQDQLPDGTYMFEYSINDDTIYSIFNNDPRSFRNVKIYASDPWHVAAKAKIRNFQVCT